MKELNNYCLTLVVKKQMEMVGGKNVWNYIEKVFQCGFASCHQSIKAFSINLHNIRILSRFCSTLII